MAGPGRRWLARATGAASLTRNESQSTYFHKGNDGLPVSGAGPGYIHVILPNARAASGVAQGLARASARQLGGPAGAGPGQAGGGSLLAGGEASVIGQQRPTRIRIVIMTSPADQGWSRGSDPKNRDQMEKEDNPGEYIYIYICTTLQNNVKNCN